MNRHGGVEIGHSRNQPAPPHRPSDPPQLSIDLLDFFQMMTGPSPMPPVRVNDPLLTEFGFWSAGMSTVHAASVAIGNDGIPAGRPLTGSSLASLPRPGGPKPSVPTSLDKFFAVN